MALIERATEIAFRNLYTDHLTYDESRPNAEARGNLACKPDARRSSIGLPSSSIDPNYRHSYYHFRNECDEYPYRSTFEGGNGTGRLASIAAVPSGEQKTQSNELQAFYATNGLRTGDDFYVDAFNDLPYNGQDPPHNP